jgi:hypothetical protein
MKFNPFHNENEVSDVLMEFGMTDKNILYLYRRSGVEVEVDTIKKTSTRQLSFKELEAIETRLPYLAIYNFKITRKTY